VRILDDLVDLVVALEVARVPGRGARAGVRRDAQAAPIDDLERAAPPGESEADMPP